MEEHVRECEERSNCTVTKRSIPNTQSGRTQECVWIFSTDKMCKCVFACVCTEVVFCTAVAEAKADFDQTYSMFLVDAYSSAFAFYICIAHPLCILYVCVCVCVYVCVCVCVCMCVYIS